MHIITFHFSEQSLVSTPTAQHQAVEQPPAQYQAVEQPMPSTPAQHQTVDQPLVSTPTGQHQALDVDTSFSLSEIGDLANQGRY